MRITARASAVLVVLLLSLSVAAKAAPPVDGVLGIPWGASRDQVERAMADQGFGKLPAPAYEFLDPTNLYYSGQYAADPAKFTIYFKNRAVYRISVELSRSNSNNASVVYQSYSVMKGALADKYGPVSRTVPPSTNSNTVRTTWTVWSLTTGDGADLVEIACGMTEPFSASGMSLSGWVQVDYTNKSLEDRLTRAGKSNI